MGPHGRLSKSFLCILAFGMMALTGSVVQAQFSTSEREIERAVRVEWMQMKRSLPRPANPAIQSFVECVANALIATLEEPYASMDWEVVVFDDDALNAFAMPGGKIGVFTGIFKAAETPDGLAAVIGHEIAHVTEDHVMSQARRQVGTDLLARAGGAMTGLYGYSSEFTRVLLNLPFSRRDESEADIVGLKYMADAGFDPRATMYLWKNMGDMRDGGEQAEFLSTHPSDVRRLDDIVRSITPALIKYNEALDAGRQPDCLGNG
ncbi:MAG: M48 family metallopeptidase [Gammaproteobacteria bacterium]|nr:M48 family metallopeptidase [Gammaproteobacteria bacterium]